VQGKRVFRLDAPCHLRLKGAKQVPAARPEMQKARLRGPSVERLAVSTQYAAVTVAEQLVVPALHTR
jgi:hypothetical protein